MGRTLVLVLLTALALSNASQVGATEQLAAEAVLTGLNQPVGIAVRLGEAVDRYEIFVAESGAGGILRLRSVEPRSTSYAVSELSPGPTAIWLLDSRNLAVAVHGGENVATSLQVFEIPEAATPVAAEKAKHQVDVKLKGENFSRINAIARTRANDKVRDALILSGTRTDQSTALLSVPLPSNTLGEPQLLAQSAELAEKLAPLAVAVDQGGYIVFSTRGSPPASAGRLVFCSPLDGSRLMELSTELPEIVALAYSPRTGNLYAAASAPESNAKQGGVFRIDAPQPSNPAKCEAEKIADIKHPTALAFGPDGILYVTSLGDGAATTPKGELLKITGEL